MIKTHASLMLAKNTAITLIEIIVASTIAVMVMAGIATMDYSVRRLYRGTTPRSMLSVEATATLQHITRNIQAATGDANIDGIRPSAGNSAAILSILQDRNPSPTPLDYTDDDWVRYRINNHSLEFVFCGTGPAFNLNNCANTPLHTLGAGRIKDFSVTRSANQAQGALDNQLTITITACLHPDTCPTADDPEFTTTTTVSTVSHGGPSI